MRVNKLKQILDHFDAGKDEEIARLAQEIRDAVSGQTNMDGLVKRISNRLNDPSADPSLEKSPSYNFILACALSHSGHKDANKYAENAAHQFKNQDKEYNESISYWMQGLNYAELGQVEKAREKLDSSISIIVALSEDTQNSGLYKISDNYGKLVKEIREFRDGLKDVPQHMPDQTVEDAVVEPHNQPPSDGLEGHLLMPHLPTYTTVQAGSEGPIWATRSVIHGHTETDELVIGDRRFHIYSVRRGDSYIVIVPKRRYGWAKVAGNSMNMARPTHIQAENMVMFYEANDAPENAIVIASVPVQDGTAGYTFMVKRWDKANMVFVSESSEPGHEPIPFDKDCKIIGVVVAVAKPTP